MITAFDSIDIQTPDLELAYRDYALFLGLPVGQDGFRLANVDIRLHAAPPRASTTISGLALRDESISPGSASAVDTGPRELSLTRTQMRPAPYQEVRSDTGIYAVDHVVLQSGDADDCIRLFSGELGLRLALDREVPEWGGRMLFFRQGKMTLEVIQSTTAPPARDFFWGISFLCEDIERTVSSLSERGLAHSPIREGRKPGTRVATIKSHCLGLPTLVIGPA